MNTRKWIAAGLVVVGGLGISFPAAPDPATTAAVGPAAAPAAGQPVEFSAERWDLSGAQTLVHLDRPSLAGTAILKDVEFENGVIEVDIAANGRTSYPGFLFRMQSGEECERFYIRPHRAGLYADALQYTPVFHGIAGWQLYSGPGFTAGGEFPRDRWVHVKLEVLGTQARVFVDNGARPALVVHDLKRGRSRGAIGLLGPPDGTAYFSGFSYRLDDSLKFDPPPPADPPPGVLTDWQISPPFRISRLDPERVSGSPELATIAWQTIRSEPSGLVDIARWHGQSGREPECVLARATLESAAGGVRKLRFGYSDVVHVYLNGRLLFSGDSSYRRRDSAFAGIVGLFDTIYLPLREGSNELLLAVTESFGGWGFIGQDAEAVFLADEVTKLWETDRLLRTPESVAWDAKRHVGYASNLDAYATGGPPGSQSIACISVDGRTVEPRWVNGLTNPTGLAILGDRLYAVERPGLVEIDLRNGTIRQRYPVAQPGFLNDVAAAPDGDVYLSDSRTGAIHRLHQGRLEPWLQSPDIGRPNGLFVLGGELIVGCNADGRLKAVDRRTQAIRTVADLGPGTIDGIQGDGAGNLLVSHNEGRLYRVTPEGKIARLLDTTAPGVQCADIDFVPALNLLLVPTFGDDRVAAYRVGPWAGEPAPR